MTVRVVMRYLVNKLGLDDDSQVWHACRFHPPHDAFFFSSPYYFLFPLSWLPYIYVCVFVLCNG